MRLSFSGGLPLVYIAYVEEYKKRNTRKDLNDVCPLYTLYLPFLLILWSLHHMMNIDRRRRFAFRATIEIPIPGSGFAVVRWYL